ncbi:MAG TPA: hypothetical protein VGI39_04060 [Polyangiaceae bacterium]|jgi:hypothetical protein
MSGGAGAQDRPASRPRAAEFLFAFGAGLLLATLTSGGIAGARLTSGSATVALLANAAVTLAAVVTLALTSRASAAGRGSQMVLPQVAGATLGVALVHLALGALGAPALVERPAQFVNDAVAVAAILLVVWSATPRTVALARAVVGTSLVVLYAVTARRWHLDAITFQGTTVQQFVGLEFTAAAIGVAVFRAMSHGDPSPHDRAG